MKIVDLKCTVIDDYPIVRIDTDEGISGLAEIERSKSYIKPHVLMYKRHIVGQDPTNVERVMLRIRRIGGYKPWGSAVSAIEMALWDIAGKAMGVPVYRLLGGKVRDKVQVYNTAYGPGPTGATPEEYAESAASRKNVPEGFRIIKFGIGFHSWMPTKVPRFFYGEIDEGPHYPNRGFVTESGLKHMVKCVKAIKEALGEEYGAAFDCGPGFDVPSALRLAKAVEEYNVMWLEDMITGDYTPYTAVEAFRMISSNTTTPIHTGEQIYLRYGFKDIIDKNAVDIIGPDPCDVGGIAELKLVAEFADMYGVLIAPHGVGNGAIGTAALVQACATLPKNYIAFEMPAIEPPQRQLVKGLPDPLIKDGFIQVPDAPGMGVELDEKVVRKRLPEGDDFFD